MAVRAESKAVLPKLRSESLLTVLPRSAQQVTDRLDGLIRKIYDIHRPNMHGESPADVVLVCNAYTPLVVLIFRSQNYARLPTDTFCAHS